MQGWHETITVVHQSTKIKGKKNPTQSSQLMHKKHDKIQFPFRIKTLNKEWKETSST